MPTHDDDKFDPLTHCVQIRIDITLPESLAEPSSRKLGIVGLIDERIVRSGRNDTIGDPITLDLANMSRMILEEAHRIIDSKIGDSDNGGPAPKSD